MRLSTHRSSVAVSFLAVIAALGLSAANAARAQGWLDDRARAEGPGIRLGDLELHPGIGAEIGYDSNIFYADQDPVGSAILRVTPHLMLSTLGPERREAGERPGSPPPVEFRAGLSASYYAFFTDRARDNVEADADLKLVIMPERPFSLTLTETLGRSIRPFTESGADDRNYARIRNNAGARIDVGTNGGVLKGHVGYNLLLDYFEGSSFDYVNNLIHRMSAGASWRFLPQTALLYDLRVGLTDYNNADARPAVRLSNNQRVRTRVGVNGAITNKISALALVGYAAGFYDDALFEEYESVSAQAELRWAISPTARFVLGYDGDYNNSFVGGFNRRDRVHADLQLLMGGAFVLGANTSAALYDFGPQLAPDGSPLGVGGTTDRSDIRVVASLFGEYRAADWLGFNGTITYTGDFTDFEYQLFDDSATPFPDPAGFQKFEAWFGVRAFY